MQGVSSLQLTQLLWIPKLPSSQSVFQAEGFKLLHGGGKNRILSSSNSNRGQPHCSVCQPNDPLRLFKLKSLCLRQPHWKTYGLLFNLLLSFLLLYIVEHTSLLTMLWLFNIESQYIDHLDRQLIFPSGAKCQTWGKLSIIWTPVYCPNWNTSLHLLVSACQCSSFRLNYKSLKKRCHSCIFRPATLSLTHCLFGYLSRLEEKPLTSPLSGALPIDRSLLLLCCRSKFSFSNFLLPLLLPGSHSQQTQAHLVVAPPFVRRNTSPVLVSYVDQTEIGWGGSERPLYNWCSL